MKKFELIEHTADIGIRVFARSREELFANSAEGLFSLLLKKEQTNASNIKKVTLKSPKLDELLVQWLNELLSLFYAEAFVPAKFSASLAETDGTLTLNATVEGDEIEDSVTLAKTEVKAATYHRLKVEQFKGGYKAEVIFDV
nr:conserved hypothetical protein of unknown function DUF101 [uncultured bacterium]